jgi:threonine dehydrogenase-like Zn-dependent dehydrogenase
MCYTGKYTERGIKERHGFQSEFVVDRQKYLVKVPEELKEAAVLCEPTSIVEKAIDLAGRIQRMRLPDWGAEDEQVFRGRRVLVAGVGAHWTARLNGVYP